VSLALLALAYNGVLISLTTLFPTDGCNLYPDQGGLTVNSAPQGSPLQQGDLITGINGRPVSQQLAQPGVWYRFLLGSPAGGATYSVERGGQRLEVWVPWQARTLVQAIGEVGLLSFIGTVFILNTILLLLSRTRGQASIVIAFFFLVEGFNLVNNAWLATGTSLTLGTFWFFHPLDLLSFGLTFAAALHAFLVFPEPKWPGLRNTLLHIAGYVFNLLVALVGIVGAAVNAASDVRVLTYRIFYPVAAVELLLGIGLLTHTYVTTRRPGARNQIRWLVWGVILGPLPWLFFYSLPVALGGPPLLPFAVTTLALIVIPASFFIAVTRRGLSLVDTVINRTMVYSVLVALLVGIYTLTVAALGGLMRLILGVADTRLSTFAAILLIVLLANPLRMTLQHLTQQLFYRRLTDMQQLLREVGERLSTTLQFDAMIPMLTEEIPNRLQITRTTLLLRQQNGAFDSSDSNVVGFPANHPLVTEAETRETPMVVSQVRNATGVLAELGAAGWEVALPLRSGGRLVGMYLLGPRRNGDLYTRQEVEALRTLGHQVAATLENAQLYSQVERYTQQLEEIVSERTQELARANLELASERDRLNVVLQNMADCLLVTNPQGEIVLVNPILESTVHQPAGQLVGRPAADALRMPALNSLLTQAVNRPDQVLTGDLHLDDKVLQASASALRDQSAVITVLRDITQEKEVDRMKTEFVSTVSHELRAPLTSVLGFAKLISKAVERDVVHWVPADDPRGQRAVTRVRENLEIIISEGERLTRLINDVLDIAKMEAGRIDWRDLSFELGTVISQAIENVRTLATAKNLPIDLQLEPGLPPLFADADRVLQVITNLLSNAVKFTDQGRVTVVARMVMPDEQFKDWTLPEGCPAAVLVTVQDTGVGIPEEAISQLFQRFQQVESTVVDRPKGTGLGLAICREIVMHYDGAIWAESKVGQGSRFCFTLPLAPTAPAVVPAPRPDRGAVPQARRATILVVDDEVHIRQLLRQMLTEAGYGVLEAAEGTIAITEARQHRPDLVILDVNMPGLSGIDVARLLRTHKGTAQIPILILSVEDPQISAGSGVTAHLTKPVEMEALLKTVARLLGREPVPPEDKQRPAPGKHDSTLGRILR
jgi:signal transduction histidine kinase/ActR/RegA family two-component response regulator